jgi:peptidoglycan/LPS O-acetylase OafA/YrhL
LEAAAMSRRRTWITLSEILPKGRNNFDIVRLCAALGVMFGHSYWIQPTHGRMEPILKHTGLEYSGSLAVFTFFLLSGILVTASAVQRKSVVKFLLLRVARIWPALAICMLVTALIIGPMFSRVPYFQFISSDQTIEWIYHNVTLLNGLRGALPGLFENTPISNVVNASIWTLPVEFKCYLVIFIAAVIGLLRLKRGAALAAILSVVVFFYIVKHPTGNFMLADVISRPTGYTLYPFLFFACGSLMFAYREKVVIDWRVCALFVISYIFLRDTIAGPTLFYLTFIYSVLLVSSITFLTKIRMNNDYSYGTYLYAFVIQQCVVQTFPNLNNLASLTISIPFTLILAALSWHLVERPCLTIARSWASSRVHTSPMEPNSNVS